MSVEGLNKSSFLAHFRSSTRFLTAEDEWFKQINYRAKLFANVNRIARLKGLNKKKTLFVNVDHRSRKYGISKYGTFKRMIKGIIDTYRVYRIINKIKK